VNRPSNIRPTAKLAERVILAGDPGRSLLIAQQLIETPPPMFNHHRGLWGYSGRAISDQLDITVQATGIGGPSLAAVVSELTELGATKFVRIGTCTAASASPLRNGDLIAVSKAFASDGASQAIGGTGPFLPSDSLTLRLTIAAGVAAKQAAVHSHDLHDNQPADADQTEVGDLSTAALFALGTTSEIETAALLIVTSDGSAAAISDQQLELAVGAAAGIAAAALSSDQPS